MMIKIDVFQLVNHHLVMPYFASSIFPANIIIVYYCFLGIQGSSSLGPVSELHWPAGHWRLPGPGILCRGWKNRSLLQTLRIPKCSPRYRIQEREVRIYWEKVTNGHQFWCWIDATSLVRRLCSFCSFTFVKWSTSNLQPCMIEGYMVF